MPIDTSTDNVFTSFIFNFYPGRFKIIMLNILYCGILDNRIEIETLKYLFTLCSQKHEITIFLEPTNDLPFSYDKFDNNVLLFKFKGEISFFSSNGQLCQLDIFCVGSG